MDIIAQAKACQICAPVLKHGVRPVFTVHPAARILIVGQAPGRKVHASGIPWDDASGKRLRAWLGVDQDHFYDPTKFAILPMGFCFPGTGKSGDLPPRPECAPQWHHALSAKMPHIELSLLIGQYAQAYYLGSRKQPTLTETVRQWRTYLPAYLPLPHPSPRNGIWLRRNPWFEAEVVPHLQQQTQRILAL
ncbi:MAG: uracil-DNA glycosylase family protein [Bacteroidetes bacterium]|nr:MAG: uracil-DNA glycosylase family protein [Bacteroidota bacterium]